jgi:hypothetical protein
MSNVALNAPSAGPSRLDAANPPREAGPQRNNSDLTPQQKELLLDLTQLTLDLVGIVDPTGAADVASGAISLARGDWLGAAISGVSALLPYAGDLAKLGKLPKLLDTISSIVNVAKQDMRFAKAVEPLMQQIRSALKGADFGFLPEAAQKAMRKLEAKADEFFRTAKLARGEGAFALAETLPYSPAGKVFGQANEASCVAASIRMVLKNGDEVPEAWVRQAAKIDDTGGKFSDAASALQQFGAGSYRAVDKATVQTLETALAKGDPVIASVKTDITGGAHAVVVDAIRDGKVYIRDPYPPGVGSSYAVSIEDFKAAFTGRAVLP